MQLLVFVLVYPLLWLIARLPFPLLYGLSDFLYFLLFHLIGYRRKVVRNNLNLVFPDKSETEKKRIEKKFYSHMCDMFLEMIKTMAIGDEGIVKRFTFTNLEIIHNLESQGKSTMVMLPHYASWEWVLSLNNQVKSLGFGVYQPIGNKYFDKLVRDIRAEFGLTLITTKETRKIIAKNAKEGIVGSYGIICDQSPMLIRTRHWGKFMGIEVPLHIGAEEMCKQHDITPVYLKVTKLKRGFYQGTFTVLTEDPRSIPDYEITDAFFREVEKSINEAPEYYFWTHRRWKHRGKKGQEPAFKGKPGQS